MMKKTLTSFTKLFMPFGLAGNIYLLGALGQGLGPVLLTPILTRRLSVTDFGEVTFVTATASILGILFSFGLPIVISRSYVLDDKSRPSIISWFNKVIYFYLALSILILSLNQNSIYAYIFAIALTFSCMQLILPLARAQDKSTSFALISVLGTLFPSLAIIFNSFTGLSVTNLTALQIGSLLAAMLSFLMVRTKVGNGQKLNKYDLKNSLRSAYPILPHMFAMMALLNIDKVIFGQEVGKSFSGFIQVIMLVATAPIMILSALNHAWLNQVLLQLKDNSKNAFSALNATISKLLALSVLLILFIVTLNSHIIQVLNPNLQITSEVSKTIILTSLCGLIYVIYLANTHLLTWLNKFWFLGISTPLSVIFQAVVIFLTIDSLGYLSAALGLGAALTLQILLLQIARNKTESRNAIKPIWQITPVVIFWSVALLFLQ
jgi:O-antigen/teichoic acid export membrane protein